MNGELLLGGLTLALWLGAAWEVMRGNRHLTRLAVDDAPPLPRWPRVSLVFAARNEEATISAAVPTMLALDYPDLELIAVNDRSEDRTGEILDALAAREPRLRVDHVRELPAGWLGKNYALHHGAQRATGDWILFTDADIHFRSDALRRAIAHAETRQLDHLAVVPQLNERGHLLGICVGAFSLIFALFLRPWQILNPRSSAHGGVGAFNLVRTTSYRAHGGHTPLRLRPDDDVKLGKLMKSGGGRSEFALGVGLISVAWYASTGQLIRGLTKNAFAGVDYRAWMILGGVAAHVLFFLWPIAALFATDGMAHVTYAASVGLMLLVSVDNQRFNGGRRWQGLFFPRRARRARLHPAAIDGRHPLARRHRVARHALPTRGAAPKSAVNYFPNRAPCRAQRSSLPRIERMETDLTDEGLARGIRAIRINPGHPW